MTRRILVSCLGWMVALLPQLGGAGAPPGLRVTTWNLQPSPAVGATGWSPSFQQSLIQEAATNLSALKPDVILLQQVAHRQSCDQLAQGLLPQEYNVAVCSAFRDPETGALSRQQVAILTKAKPYLAWPVSWKNGRATPALSGGWAFAAVRVAGQNVGFFSVQFGDGALAKSLVAPQQREESARQLIEQIATMGNWTTNRPESFFVGGNFNTTLDDPTLRGESTLANLEALGFADSFTGVPMDQRITLPANSHRPGATVDYIFSKNAHAVGHPLISRPALMEHCAVTCDLEFALPPVEILATSTPTPPTAIPKANTDIHRDYRVSAIIAGSLILIAWVLWKIGSRRFHRSPAKWPSARASRISGITLSSATTNVMAPEEQQSVVAEVSRWAKQKIVQTLVSDRRQLLATQQAAARKVMEVDERLSNLEQQIQKRRSEYERRIDELLKELSTSRAENRELIEARITLLKLQMEQERQKNSR
jgi:Endonuclease/Exonuclease/phosphatase family